MKLPFAMAGGRFGAHRATDGEIPLPSRKIRVILTVLVDVPSCKTTGIEKTCYPSPSTRSASLLP